MEALSVEECRPFLAAARGSRWFGLFALALTIGMRPSEYLALKWNDIDCQRGTVSVFRTIQIGGSGWSFDDTKRKRSRRVVKLRGFVLEALESVRNSHRPPAEHDLIFRSDTGDPLKQRTVSSHGFSNTDIAIIINAFLIAYTFGQLLSGWFLDRIGARRGFALAALLWSLASILTSLAQGVWSFSFYRFLLGLSESATYPGGVKVVAEWFSEKERSTAVGIFSSGASIGAILTPPLVVYLIHYFGWRLAFVFVGFPGFVWVLVWRRVYPGPSTKQGLHIMAPPMVLPERDNMAPSPPGLTWRFFMRRREILAVFLGRLIEEPVYWFYFNWLAIYLKSFLNVSLVNTGMLLMIPFVTLDVGFVGGGWAASRLMKSGWTLDIARKTVMISSALCMISSIPAIHAATSLRFTLWISLATLGHGSWGANIFTVPGDLVPSRWVGTVYGITAFGGGLGSIIFMQLTGRLVDSQRSFNTAFVIAGILPVAASLVFVALVGKIREIDIPSSVPDSGGRPVYPA